MTSLQGAARGRMNRNRDVGPSPKKHRSGPSSAARRRTDAEQAEQAPTGTGPAQPDQAGSPGLVHEFQQRMHLAVTLAEPEEAGGSNEQEVAALPGGEPAVTDAAKAFRELRVRPAHSGNDRSGGSDGGPPSPKKRKATSNLDKEFILKDDKVKRATDTQGDISEARGMLGTLLHEFSQIELNRDLLEAIKRTESKTGRLGRAASASSLDRPAFERVVADACELLQTQLSTVEAHTDSNERRSAILRAYAVHAIAEFANEEESNSEEVEEAEEQGQGEGASAGDEGAGGQGASEGAADELAGPSDGTEDEGEDQGLHLSSAAQDGRPPRPRSGAAFYSPRRGLHKQQQARQDELQQQQHERQKQQQQQGSGGEQVSSSVLPDAPLESALEDTAAMCGAAEGQQVQQQQQQQGGAGGLEASQHPSQGAADSGVEPVSSGHDALMAVLSEATLEDMVRSPDQVDSRPQAPQASMQQLQQRRQQQQGRQQQETGAAGAVDEQKRPPRHPHAQGKREASGQAGADSSGRTGSDAAANEQPKRQRKGSSGVGGALTQLLQRRQGLAGQAPEPAGPEEEEEEESRKGRELQGDGATSGFRHSSLPPQEEGEEGEGGAQRKQAASEEELTFNQHQGQQGRLALQKRKGPAGAAGARAASPAAQDREPEQEQQEPNSSDVSHKAPAHAGAAQLQQQHSASSVWGSTLVCADLTVNDVASQYWPFLHSAMQGQGPALHEDDEGLISALVGALGGAIAQSYAVHTLRGSRGSRPPADLKSLLAATAFEELASSAAVSAWVVRWPDPIPATSGS